MTVVGLSGREGGTVEEGERLLALRLLERGLERVNVTPVLENNVLLLREAERASWSKSSMTREPGGGRRANDDGPTGGRAERVSTRAQHHGPTRPQAPLARLDRPETR